jgi:hypothetical protein
MLKRKRESNTPRAPGGGAPDAIFQRKGEVEEKLVHGKKMLNRALKTAKGFEWQKLVKRITNAKAEDGDTEAQVARLERELKVLKVSFLSHVLVLGKLLLTGGVGSGDAGACGFACAQDAVEVENDRGVGATAGLCEAACAENWFGRGYTGYG